MVSGIKVIDQAHDKSDYRIYSLNKGYHWSKFYFHKGRCAAVSLQTVQVEKLSEQSLDRKDQVNVIYILRKCYQKLKNVLKTVLDKYCWIYKIYLKNKESMVSKEMYILLNIQKSILRLPN